MKHNIKVTLILLGMFILAQVIGIYVTHQYSPQVILAQNATGEYENKTVYNLPSWFEPPADVHPQDAVISIVIALCFAVLIMLALMKLRAETFLRLWFFVVIIMGLLVSFKAFILHVPNSTWIALAIAVPLAFWKVFKRNMLIHNITEVFVYPGIASIFIPLLGTTIWTAVVLLIIISLYDMYAVWHAGFMQKMAQYQIQKVRIFTGFFVPYVNKKDRAYLAKAQTTSKSKNKKKIDVQVGILGGGDVVFPIILAGVVQRTLGLIPALFVAVGATIALALLFYYSQKGKFYPAMPFISAGCLAALGLSYLI